MRAWALAAMVVIVTLSGCADSAPAGGPADETFDDVDVRVDDDSGVILGVIVNEVVEPVVAATVTLQADGRTAQSDDRGRFVFEDVEAGTHFLTVTKVAHEETQVSTTVVAGVSSPPVVKVQLPRLFEADPFMQSFQFEGFFTCSQNGVFLLWSSSPCVFDQTKHSLVPPPANGALPVLDGATPEDRDFHVDVGAGWQTMVWEMTWEASAQGTSENMGMVVSTYKPERCTCHWFANVGGGEPLRLQLDAGVTHETAASEEPTAVPPGGIEQMSFFTSVRAPDGNVNTGLGPRAPPGIAIDQSFTIYHNQFYYAPAPEGWSFLDGDGNPF